VDWDELARWKMIDQTLELGLPEPEETYSSSEHLYETLDIPKGSTGRLNQSKPTQSPKKSTVVSVKAEQGKPRAERTRTRTKKFKES
jgi:hypothetical protein